MTVPPVPGYRIVKTDERVEVLGTRITRRGAERLAASHPPIIPSYHLRIERRRLFAWDVVAYQNRLESERAAER
jgi:hypothetical protein